MAGTPRRRGPAAGRSLWRIRRRTARRQQPRIRLRGPPLSAPPDHHESVGGHSRTLAQARSRLRCRAPGFAPRPRRSNVRTTPLVSPPVALTIDVFARILAEVGRADDEDLEALRPGLVASPRTGRDAHRVPLFELDDLVVDFHPAAPAQDHVHLLLLHVRVAVRKAIAGRDALVVQGGFLELERL